MILKFYIKKKKYMGGGRENNKFLTIFQNRVILEQKGIFFKLYID